MRGIVKTDIYQLKKWNIENEFDIDHAFIKLTKDTLQRLKEYTPVDTGKLRNGWDKTDIVKKIKEQYVYFTNPIEYFDFVNDGHYTKNYSSYISGQEFVQRALRTMNFKNIRIEK